jgi:predicted nucleic acid-binding protein
MARFVLLDSGPLGLLGHPHQSVDIRQWVDRLIKAGTRIGVPEIADYEVRRELLRAGRGNSIRRLDRLKATLYYLPLTTEAMLQAAKYWADTRRRGRPTAPDPALDGDVILAAQAHVLVVAGHEVIVATDNVKHLAPFVDACEWQNIPQ